VRELLRVEKSSSQIAGGDTDQINLGRKPDQSAAATWRDP